MRKETIEKYKLDYLIILALWILIFGKNIFSNYILLDYSPDTFFSFKTLVSSNYTSVLSLFDLFKLVLSFFNLLSIAFTLSILISMLLSYFYIKKLVNSNLLYSLLFSLIFFFNPFVYSRIAVGQLGVLLAYLFFPIYLYYLFLMFHQTTWKNTAKTIIAYTITALFSIHFFALNFLIFILASIFLVNWKQEAKKYIKIFLIFFIVLIALNAFWLQGFFSNSIFSSINSEHESFFSPKQSENLPSIAKILGMYGFWREASYKTSYNLLPLPIFYIFLILLVILTLIGYYHDHTKKAKFFFSLFWIGLILGVGISHPYTSSFFDFLFKNLLFFNGFRDSHKFVSFLALSYAYFIPQTIINIKNKLQNKTFKLLLIIVFIAFILALTFPLAFTSQIKPINYPQEYYELNSQLNNVTGYIIYLPWQTYLTYSWSTNSSSDGRIAVPINKIIKNSVLIGSDTYGSQSYLIENITSCLNQKNSSCLEALGVQYVIKDKCAYFPENYSFINNIYENSCLELNKLNNKIQAEEIKMPLRFTLGIIISIITLIILLMSMKKENRKLN